MHEPVGHLFLRFLIAAFRQQRFDVGAALLSLHILDHVRRALRRRHHDQMCIRDSLSVGIENIEDILEDLEQAFDKI